MGSGRTIDLIPADDLGVDDVVEVVTEIFQIEGEVNGNEFHILCPVHDESNPSCDVNVETGFWNCFSCGAGSDIVGLGVRALGKSRKEVISILRPTEPGAIAASIRARLKKQKKESVGKDKKVFVPSIPALGSYSNLKGQPLRELQDRGFKRKVLESFGIRFVKRAVLMKDPDSVTEGKKDHFEITNAVGIPIVGHQGVPVAWCYRATEDSERWFRKTRYLYTPGVNDTLNRTWFGLYRHRHESSIVVVEGALDAIWCAQNGHPAVAMLGTNAKQFEKVDALTSFRRVTILGDRDAPGEMAVIRLGSDLTALGTPVTIAAYRKWMRGRHGKRASDPQELCPIDLELAIDTAEPWPIWSRSEDVQELVRAIGYQKGKNQLAKSRRT